MEASSRYDELAQNLPQRILYCNAAMHLLCGGITILANQFDTTAPPVGFSTAAVATVLGLLAGQLRRNRALAFLAIDLGLIFMFASALNFARLTYKWQEQSGIATYMTVIGVALALGNLLAFRLLHRNRPVTDPSLGDWWTTSPLLALPAVVLSPLQQIGHFGVARRLAFVTGGFLLVIGFVSTSSSRLPDTALAGVVTAVSLSIEHDELIREVLADRERLRRLLQDQRMQMLLESSAARDVVQRVIDGEIDLDDGGVAVARELVAAGVTINDVESLLDDVRSGRIDVPEDLRSLELAEAALRELAVGADDDEIEAIAHGLRTGRLEVPDELARVEVGGRSVERMLAETRPEDIDEAIALIRTGSVDVPVMLHGLELGGSGAGVPLEGRWRGGSGGVAVGRSELRPARRIDDRIYPEIISTYRTPDIASQVGGTRLASSGWPDHIQPRRDDEFKLVWKPSAPAWWEGAADDWPRVVVVDDGDAWDDPPRASARSVDLDEIARVFEQTFPADALGARPRLVKIRRLGYLLGLAGMIGGLILISASLARR